VIAGGLPQRATYSGAVLPSGEIAAPEIGAFAPPFRAPTLDGEITLEQLRGVPVVLNFWATWCVPCRVEMPWRTRMFPCWRSILANRAN
jgi:thiol-disulfide isomerase/thioredoxin